MLKRTQKITFTKNGTRKTQRTSIKYRRARLTIPPIFLTLLQLNSVENYVEMYYEDGKLIIKKLETGIGESKNEE